ncbi:filamentous hemagglutinin N-terminal domain-containing protein [Aerosakkonemataceae cyanobacterium BLCC-F50]|uniref:Filamentous hemagglutinin N-terminal domain-containing protein n=1 Tax=Floridaenema flaviceps BLCC-F50 TaxID=3153642 RepID=A0ABV4XQ53_9CYAN
MKNNLKQLGIISVLLLSAYNPLSAQVIPDATLPNNTIVIPNGNTIRIEGGTTSGSNLFHSFQEFSLPTGGEAFFNNSVDIQNIFSRVTGKNISNIDGLIRANGRANLFLINPYGIIFGPNAQLNIGGSFIASTANSIKFNDGSIFSATNTNTKPLLTVNVPIGLQFGSNPPGKIAVQGSNLAVQTGQTLALVGGDITISGSTNPLATGLTAGGIPIVFSQGNFVPTTPGGRIELGSVTQGDVNFTTSNKGFVFNYLNAQNFGDIQLLGNARVDTSGTGGGEIQIQARNLRLSEGSRLSSFTLGDLPGGVIAVNTSESVEIVGTGGYEQNVVKFSTGTVTINDLINGFFTLTFGSGKAGDIIINTPDFLASNGSYIAASTFGGEGGNITLNTSDLLQLSAAFIATGTGVNAVGNSGEITINTRRFLAQDNGLITTSSFGVGKGGDLTLNAADSIAISSGNPIPISPTVRAFGGIFTSGLGLGDAGELRINTRQLTLSSGAVLAASSFGQGQGGDMIIKASEFVKLQGNSADGQLLSAITSVTEPGSLGRGGNLTIQTDRLILRDGGRVSIRSRGTGNAGNLIVEANSVLMNNNSGLEGTSASGEGGNFTVRSRIIEMRNNSFISATAGTEGGPGNGGNININTNSLVALGNSDITANSVASQGGRVTINAQGIFGIQYRLATTPNSDITATGGTPDLSGTVQINTPEVDTSAGLVQLPENFTDLSNQIVAGCGSSRGNTFVITGRGGLPEDPNQALRSATVWRDLRSFEQGRWGDGEMGRDLALLSPPIPLPPHRSADQDGSPPTSIIEATGWVKNADGKVELITQSTTENLWYKLPQCSGF